MAVIQAAAAFQRYVEAGKSELFVETVDLLRGQPHDDSLFAPEPAPLFGGFSKAAGGSLSPRGERSLKLRYPRGVMDELEAMLATRSRDLLDARLQLVCFAWALGRATSYEEASWQTLYLELERYGRAVPASFAKLFENRLAGRADTELELDLNAGKLLFAFPDRAKPYALSFLRMPLLDALTGYLLNTGDDELRLGAQGLLAEAAEGPLDYARFQAAANALDKLLGAHLDGEVRSRDELERFRRLLRWLEGRFGEAQEWTFDDELVLAFWKDAARDPKTHGDHVKFESALTAVAATARELIVADFVHRARKQEAVAIGGNVEEGERDVAASAEDIAHGSRGGVSMGPVTVDEDAFDEDDGLPLGAFAKGGEFESLNLLSNAEILRLRRVLALSGVFDPFARSHLRREAFGFVQNQMINAQRFKRHDEIKELAGLAAFEGERANAYFEAREQLAKDCAYLDRLLKAGFAVALRWDPASLKGHPMLIALIEEHGRDLEAIKESCERAHRQVTRRGFSSTLDDRETGELFLDALDHLLKAVSRLNPALRTIDRLGDERVLREKLLHDRVVFAEMFATLAEEQ